jgi:hypothetical protein
MCEAPELPKSKKRNGNFIVFNIGLKGSLIFSELERGFLGNPKNPK